MEIIYLDVIAIAQHIDMHDDLVSNDDNIYLFDCCSFSIKKALCRRAIIKISQNNEILSRKGNYYWSGEW